MIYTEEELLGHLRELCESAGGAKPWSIKHKISHSYVSTVLRKERPIGEKLQQALGVKRVVRYVKKGQTKPVMMKFEDI